MSDYKLVAMFQFCCGIFVVSMRSVVNNRMGMSEEGTGLGKLS